MFVVEQNDSLALQKQVKHKYEEQELQPTYP